ncbi:MAG: hypothetical protein LWW78_04700 [Deltaproteobacteria bacterium]|nr:hypothetical protein [Deltaproteobacteria bacterium]MDL1972522.1 hypothetical protein [Deltaproteobacteria bacterium]
MRKLIKQQIKALLQERNFEKLLNLCEENTHAWKALRFCLYETDEEIRWAAIEATAKLMQRWWQKGKREKVREYMRNLFWSMNDESGGIGWSAPQSVAEIIIHIPQLLRPYGSMMIGHALDEPPLVKSGLWGIGRLGRHLTDIIKYFQDKLLIVFQVNDTETIGLAAWSMGEVGFTPALPFLKKLQKRRERVQIYIEGHFYEKTLGQWAKEAITKIKNTEIGLDKILLSDNI